MTKRVTATKIAKTLDSQIRIEEDRMNSRCRAAQELLVRIGEARRRSKTGEVARLQAEYEATQRLFGLASANLVMLGAIQDGKTS